LILALHLALQPSAAFLLLLVSISAWSRRGLCSNPYLHFLHCCKQSILSNQFLQTLLQKTFPFVQEGSKFGLGEVNVRLLLRGHRDGPSAVCQELIEHNIVLNRWFVASNLDIPVGHHQKAFAQFCAQLEIMVEKLVMLF